MDYKQNAGYKRVNITMYKWVFSILIVLLGYAAQAQSDFVKTVKEYYRVSPFDGSFSGFVKALTTDSLLLKKEIFKQTDTSGYLVKGEYQVFNPYSINADRVDMVFYENIYKNEDDAAFKFYTYQLTTYFPDTEAARRAILKDYKLLVRKFRKSLYYSKIQSLKGYKEVEDGEITTLNDEANATPPVIVSWQTLGKSKQLGLTVILRIVQSNNRAFPVGN